MNEAEREFHPQEQFGRALNENEFMMFQVLMHSPETVVSLFNRKCSLSIFFFKFKHSLYLSCYV